MSEAEAASILVALETADARHRKELHAEHRNNAHLAFRFLADLALGDRVVDRAALSWVLYDGADTIGHL